MQSDIGSLLPLSPWCFFQAGHNCRSKSFCWVGILSSLIRCRVPSKNMNCSQYGKGFMQAPAWLLHFQWAIQVLPSGRVPSQQFVENNHWPWQWFELFLGSYVPFWLTSQLYVNIHVTGSFFWRFPFGAMASLNRQFHLDHFHKRVNVQKHLMNWVPVKPLKWSIVRAALPCISSHALFPPPTTCGLPTPVLTSVVHPHLSRLSFLPREIHP